jgi:hypothetical protein
MTTSLGRKFFGSTLRRRRDEWIGLGVMERLRRICLHAYDRLIGLELSEVAVDCCVSEAQKAEGRRRRAETLRKISREAQRQPLWAGRTLPGHQNGRLKR